jgi:hypothetical protein
MILQTTNTLLFPILYLLLVIFFFKLFKAMLDKELLGFTIYPKAMLDKELLGFTIYPKAMLDKELLGFTIYPKAMLDKELLGFTIYPQAMLDKELLGITIFRSSSQTKFNKPVVSDYVFIAKQVRNTIGNYKLVLSLYGVEIGRDGKGMPLFFLKSVTSAVNKKVQYEFFKEKYNTSQKIEAYYSRSNKNKKNRQTDSSFTSALGFTSLFVTIILLLCCR